MLSILSTEIDVTMEIYFRNLNVSFDILFSKPIYQLLKSFMDWKLLSGNNFINGEFQDTELFVLIIF